MKKEKLSKGATRSLAIAVIGTLLILAGAVEILYFNSKSEHLLAKANLKFRDLIIQTNNVFIDLLEETEVEITKKYTKETNFLKYRADKLTLRINELEARIKYLEYLYETKEKE